MVKKIATSLLQPTQRIRPRLIGRIINRTAFLIVFVFFLHIIAFYFAVTHSALSIKETAVAEIQLLPLRTIETIAAIPAKKTAPTKKKTPKTKIKTPPKTALLKTSPEKKQEADVTSSPSANNTPLPLSVEAENPPKTPEESAEPPPINAETEEGPLPPTPSTQESKPTKTPESEKFSLPPSALITYTAHINGVRNLDSSIRWLNTDKRYELRVEIPLPVIGTFSYHSIGHIDQYGLAPTRYEERRGKRAPVASNFNRDERQTISFSKVTTILPLVDAAQDRFSVLWQLISLSRGNPEKNNLGATRVFYVVDTDQGEEWKIQALEEESIELEEGWVRARHFVRLPRYPDDHRKLEVWLAPSKGWLPVKIQQTEPNGYVLELFFKKRVPLTSEE